jgi:hypothetical protein
MPNKKKWANPIEMVYKANEYTTVEIQAIGHFGSLLAPQPT